jgi:plastocyanin
VKQLRVTLTDGSVQVLEDLAVDQRVVVSEVVSRGDDDLDGVPDDWDVCPGTQLGWRSDFQGCAMGQRMGLAVGLEEPAQGAVIATPPTFRWSGEVQSAVVQVGTDGTFGPAGRIDLGPVSGSSLQPDDAQWKALREASDGSRPLLWRVVAVGADGGERITEPRLLYVAVEADVMRVPFGANIFFPAHIAVPTGTTVTWWNDSVAAGNLQNEIHDVQLYNGQGDVLSAMWDLDGGAAWTWTFPEPGFYSAVCHRHSGYGSHGDTVRETTTLPHTAPPHRCMSGTVTVY